MHRWTGPVREQLLVNGNRNLTSWRQVKVDHLRVYGSSVAAVGTRPRSRSLSR
jgi:predicted SpoU family rRNA methylase